jgi:glycosyltransferase involved in cell wall biosynthesis
MEKKLHALVKEMNLHGDVEMVGSIPNSELPQHYHWADIMIHTSLHEGLPSVAAEAMASGVVICATRVGIFDDLGETYFETVDVGDHSHLARKTIQLWSDKKKFAELRERSVAWAQQFNLRWAVTEFAKLYDDLMKNK